MRLLAISCAFLVLIAAPASAQHALVLSGGGARGLSHAGAIAALEELGYRPAFVTGASMGAIIGALYAAGYPAAQIREIIADENWLERMASAPVTIGPDRSARRPLLGFGISSGRFYGGVLSSPGIDQRLIELLFDAGVRARNDFDRLPVPYRPVAADLATGEEVVLSGGDLPRAVRASMAVPGAFAPVRWGDRVLIDGGVANNLPVSVARELTDMPVIAIDVLRPDTVVEERGALDLVVRSLRLLIENARPEAQADILVLPDLEAGFSESYFPADATDVLQRGYDAVRAQVMPVAQQPESRRAPGGAPERIGALRVDGTDAAGVRLIHRIMRGAVRAYDADDIIERTSALYRTGLFQAVWPRLEFSDEGVDPTLVVEVTPVASTSVIGGAHWNNDVGGRAWLSLRQGVSLNTPVELRMGGTIDQIGHAASADVSFFSALLPGLVWNGGARAAERHIRISGADSATLLPFARRMGGWAGAEVRGPVPDWFFSARGQADHVRGADGPEGWAIGPVVRIARLPAPDRVVGLDPLLEAEVRGGDLEYSRARVRLGPDLAVGRGRIAVVLEAATSSLDTPLDALPVIDRDIAPWLPAGTLGGRHLAVVGADAAVPTLLSGHARVRLRAIAAVDDTDDLMDGSVWRVGGEIGAIWPTVLGPITLGAALGQRTSWRFNIAVGADF